jgi:hypothetical protein
MLLLLTLLPILLTANLTLNVNVPAWNLSRSGQDANLPLLMQPGNPALPFYPVRVLLPMGERVTDIEVIFAHDKNFRHNVSLDFVRTPQPVSQAMPDLTEKNQAVWSADTFYPVQNFAFLGEQQGRGYRLAVINLYPWQYNPVSRELISASNVQLNISTEADAELAESQSEMLALDEAVRSGFSNSVLNPQQISSYVRTSLHAPATRYVNPNDPKKMLIITSQNRMAWFNAYAAWKETQDIPTGIVSIESILSDYTGRDDAEKLRTFIIDAYLSWITSSDPLQYVILAGDDEFIPVRGVVGSVGDTYDARMPCDLYYGCLDGNWNADNDNLWGEYPQDNPDLLPEVYVGRWPAETEVEFQHIMDKTMFYTNNNTFSNNIAIFFGENLNNNPLTWGGDYKDAVAVYLPEEYHLETHYQRDNTYSAPIVIEAINSGAAIMNHMGHANEVFLMGQSNGTVEGLTNTEYGFLYSQGCYPAAFDQATSGIGECIGEHFVTTSGGLYAFIGNTRYGWYMPGSIDGPSEYFDRAFFQGMFQYNLPRLGQAMEFSLGQNLNYAMQDDVMLWCYYETILFGDPSTAVKLPNPNLPCLSLHDYQYDDTEGDGDGNLNPGEIIRLYPEISNLDGWGAAYNVQVTLEGLPAGVTLLNSSINVSPLASGALLDTTLCLRFQLPNAMAFGTYNYKIRLQAAEIAGGPVSCDRRYDASMDITLLDSHFPWDFYSAGKSAPVVGDLQFNNESQILFVDVDGDGYFINALGQAVGGFDFTTDENLNRSFAAGMYEIINTPMYAYAFSSRTGKIYAVAHKDTTNFFYINYDTGSTCLYTPVIADLDFNSYSEVIAAAQNKKIYALDYNNQLLPGFPVELSAAVTSELAVADLDFNNNKEIIAGTGDGKLWVIEYDGTIRPGFPVQLSGPVNGSPLILNNHCIAVGTPGHLYIVSPDCTIWRTIQMEGDMAGGAIPVDLDRDGDLDIVFVTTGGLLYAFRQDGSDLDGFPVATGTFFNCPPLAADLDGDYQYEIILQNHLNSIYIYNHNGTAVPGFPFTQNYNGSTPATLTDFDRDGNYELVTGYSNGVLVIKLRRPLGGLDAWTTYRGSLNRQGSFAATGFVGNEDEVAVSEITLEAAYPNPFKAQATLSFSLPKAEQQVSLAIYNSKGQRVKTLYTGSADKGRHSLVWDGRDESGRPVGSGVYFYRLLTDGKVTSRKMLLLK